MAILITNQSHFKPLSFEEMLKPYQMLTEEYNAVEKGIADLDAEAESMRQIAQKEIDSARAEGRTAKSFATEYMVYANSLDEKADQLAREGLKGVSRKDLYDLQAQYKTKVKPIEDAVNTIKTYADEQRKLGPDYAFDNDYMSGNISVQDLIDNPNKGYRAYSLEDYGKRGALAGASILNRLNEKAVLNKESNGQWWDITKGISEKDFINWMSGNTSQISSENLNALNDLKSQVDTIIGDVPESVKEQLLARTLEGAYSSLKESHTTRANSNFISDYQQEQLNLKRSEAINKAKKNGIKNINKTYLSFANDKQIMNDLASLIDDKGNFINEKDLFDDNGKLKSYNTIKVIENPQIYSKYNEGLTFERDVENPIYSSLLELGFTAEELDNMNKEDVKSLFKSFKNDSRNDAAARQVYRFPLDNTATDYLKSKLISTMSNAELEEVKSIKGGKTEYGSKKPINKIFTEGESSNILFDPVDNEFRIQAGGKYYKLPAGMLSNEVYSKINNYLQPNESFGGMSKLQGLQNAIDILENKESLSEQDYLRLVRYYDELSEIDSMFGTVGNDFVKYIGKKNINE